ncbi:MAG: Gfo/Idh/MocA family oxidoreductase [Verrucomicrobia bacterium]|nr:Gfo/Idh/MocA family oxidoreductase [Verrucomicrobiota bacterium]
MNDTKDSIDSTKPVETETIDLTRRSFLRSSAVTGAGVYLASTRSVKAQEPSDLLRVALIGCGAQGQALLTASMSVAQEAGIRFVACCDIWNYHRDTIAGRLSKDPVYKANGWTVNAYERIEEMLEKEGDNIDVCLLATPDFVHAPHTIMCLEAGKHVYCEKMMAHTIEDAKSMVLAQRRTGNLLQIGHQRRSNPRYLALRSQIIHGNQLLGRMTHANAQWNRAVSKPLGWGRKYEMDPARLKEFGYNSMLEFRNWRWFKAYGGGPMSDLGAHQIDLFAWMFDALPKAVVASGGRDYYDEFEHHDNAMMVYEFDSDAGARFGGDNLGVRTARASYQVLTTTGSQSFYEKFMGVNGSVAISELPSPNAAYREAHAQPWDSYASAGLIKRAAGSVDVKNKFWEQPRPWPKPPGDTLWLANGRWVPQTSSDGPAAIVDVRATASLDEWELATALNKPAHAPHLENFYYVAKNSENQADLNCPVSEAYKTCVMVLRVNDAIEQGKRIEFSPSDFVVA